MRLETGWRIVRAMITGAVMAAAIGCGSSEDGGGTGGTGLGGGGTRSVSVGAVTDTEGGVAVNGTRYATEGATISMGGEAADVSAIKHGMVVRITGTTDETGLTGDAETIVYAADVKGPVEVVSEAEGRLTVLGQTVYVDNLTYIENLAGQTVPASEIGTAVQIDNIVEVSGYRDGSGAVRATRIEVKSSVFEAGMTLELRGLVESPVSADAFVMGGLTVMHDGATTVEEGAAVEVRATALPNGGTLSASSVEREDPLAAADEKIEIEGLVTLVDVAVSAQAGEFLVGNQRVRTDAATRFENGPPGDVTVNAKVEAEGRIGADGVLVASKVSFRSNVRIEAPVTAVDQDHIVVLGKTVLVNTLTETRDLLGELLPLLSNIVVHDFVEVRGYVDREGNIVATRLERDDPLSDGRVILQGPVSAVSATTSLTILDITVDTAGASRFQAQDDTVISAAEFYASVTAGRSVVKAKGAFNLLFFNRLSAEEVELEN